MAIGDQQDIFNRLKGTIPRWFGDDTPILDALITGIASASAAIYELYQYAKLQTRIKTATDGWLDMIAADFFGTRVLRKAGQSDTSFRATIITQILRERGTRAGIIKVIEDLTGRTPLVFEPMRPADTGGYRVGGVGYGVAGGYGSLAVGPYQGFVTVFRPIGTGVPFVAGYGISTGGYATASRAAYASIDQVTQAVTDQDIYDAISDVKPEGTTVWTRITN
jgi:hypothetical protein